MNIQHNGVLVEKLAAEYVLGTLKGGARRRFEFLMRDSAALRRAVAEWHDRLHPMAEFAPAQQVPPRVWNAIATQLDLGRKKVDGKPSFWRAWRDDLSFWRGLGMSSTALAAILVAVLITRQPDTAVPAASYVAMLADDKSQPIAVVTGDAKRRQMTVKMLTSQSVAADKSLELWAVPKDGPPRSLGLVADNGSITLPMPENMSPQSIPLLAVTLEPKGGSPDPNGPTGPIVFKGPWLAI
jgi:anti-sigma-K factor RskA